MDTQSRVYTLKCSLSLQTAVLAASLQLHCPRVTVYWHLAKSRGKFLKKSDACKNVSSENLDLYMGMAFVTLGLCNVAIMWKLEGQNQLCSLQLWTCQDGLLYRHRSFSSSFVLNPRHWSWIHVHKAPLKKKRLNCIESHSVLRVIESYGLCKTDSKQVFMTPVHDVRLPLASALYFQQPLAAEGVWAWSTGLPSQCVNTTHCNSTQEKNHQPPKQQHSPDFYLL